MCSFSHHLLCVKYVPAKVLNAGESKSNSQPLPSGNSKNSQIQRGIGLYAISQATNYKLLRLGKSGIFKWLNDRQGTG